ncbi:YdcF family protein [Microbacteriaceae bacterium VKM Ac-2854]|nr:YdcF family protein [Microbacteriaceae bacterium VKM Ac-2854]
MARSSPARAGALAGAVAAASAVAAATTVLLASEVVHARSSRRRLGRAPRPGARTAVVVFGYRNAAREANAVNRFRVRAGLRSIPADADPLTLIFTGGAVGGAETEAAIMARYARRSGYAGAFTLETESRTTWQNVQNVIPLIEDADRIVFVSNPLHAEKARGYLWTLRADLADRLVRAADHRFGETALLKPVAAAIGLADLWSSRRNVAASGRSSGG